MRMSGTLNNIDEESRTPQEAPVEEETPKPSWCRQHCPTLPPWMRTKKFRFLLRAAILCIVIVVTSTVVAMKNRKDRESRAALDAAFENALEGPSLAPSAAPTSLRLDGPWTFANLVQRLLMDDSSSATSSNTTGLPYLSTFYQQDATNPAARALAWMESQPRWWQDPTQFSEEQFRQRFALASLYYATSADWKDDCAFLTEQPECEWRCLIYTTLETPVFVTTDGRMGVGCDGNGTVVAVEFGTYPWSLNVMHYYVHA
jgi:hypothetical protein